MYQGDKLLEPNILETGVRDGKNYSIKAYNATTNEDFKIVFSAEGKIDIDDEYKIVYAFVHYKIEEISLQYILLAVALIIGIVIGVYFVIVVKRKKRKKNVHREALPSQECKPKYNVEGLLKKPRKIPVTKNEKHANEEEIRKN
ncbi:MAG: hypothetical protein QMC80_01975 [Thermoplasmatales archaeon]|nr:hypothetical protein [Thermoplasmatales archaeon]